MRRIERITGAIAATHVRLAIVLALAAAIFLNLAIVHRAQGAQVGERVRSTHSTTNDVIDVRGPGPAPGHGASVY